MKKEITNRDGFTVVELIVGMSVFAILITVAVGAFIQAIRTQRLLTNLMEVNNNAGLVLEQLAREVRTGYLFCGDGTVACDNVSSPSLNFKNFEGTSVSYGLANGAITRTVGGARVALTASDVNIRNLNFIIDQKNANLCNPWRVTILMEVASRNPAVNQFVPLQSTVSSRVLPRDVPGAPEALINQCGT